MDHRVASLARSSVVVVASLALAACAVSGSEEESAGAQGNAGNDGTGGTGGSSGGSLNVAGESSGGGAGTGAAGGASGGADVLIDDCPGPLSAADQATLQAGGNVNSLRWLYPFEGTVFPRGLLSPVLQWNSTSPAAEGVYIRMTSKRFEYRGCFGPNAASQLPIPQTAWETATAKSEGVNDPLRVELTTLQGGVAEGPAAETWTIALASLKSTLYYNTYNSPQVGNNGTVMRLLAGAQQPQAFMTVAGVSPVGPCVSCHSVSANGSRMIAASHFYPAGPYTSASHDVKSFPGPNPPVLAGNLEEAAFAAIYPDGSRFMTTGTPSTTTMFPFPNGPSNVVGMVGPKTSRLFDTDTGQQLAAPGWDVEYAKMPMFSPDGKKIAFNHHEASNGHSLAVMDFDASTNTFSNLVEIFRDAARFPGWPMFTPDSKSVVFVLGNVDDYVSAHPARLWVAQSDLYVVDIATKFYTPLARANGFSGPNTYLPYPGRDEHYEFFPTVSPVAAGGYFWLFFTSRRNYGNTIVGDVGEPKSKKIWVSALKIGAPASTDPSYPAFYLPGQELESGNIRAFATLEPCKADGESCNVGIDCCCGACDQGLCGCPDGCSNIDEKCETSADCCEAGVVCIGGFCALPAPR
jgi:hypothetical protein